MSRAGVDVFVTTTNGSADAMGDTSISPAAFLSGRLRASRGFSTTANGVVSNASVEPGTASRRLDFESTTGGGALRAISSPDSNQLPRACLGEGDMPGTDDSASGGSLAD
jgi:hypothetical protein